MSAPSVFLGRRGIHRRAEGGNPMTIRRTGGITCDRRKTATVARNLRATSSRNTLPGLGATNDIPPGTQRGGSRQMIPLRLERLEFRIDPAREIGGGANHRRRPKVGDGFRRLHNTSLHVRENPEQKGKGSGAHRQIKKCVVLPSIIGRKFVFRHHLLR